MSWTPEQLEAIQERQKNILVSASAGSGKTAVLVERILSIVTEELVPLSEFLVVTFTNAAAQEMRERIAKRLVALKKERHQERAFVSEQLQKVQQAHISTLHSFCKDVLAKNFYLLDIDPNFRIGSQQILELKQQAALNAVFEAKYKENHSSFLDLMSIFSSHRGDEKLKQLILALYQFSRAHPYPNQWLDNCVANYSNNPVSEAKTEVSDSNSEESDSNRSTSFDKIPFANALKSRVCQVVLDLKNQLDLALSLCLGPEGPEAYGVTLQEDLASFARALDLEEKSTWASFEAGIAQIGFERLKTIKKADKDSVSTEIADQVKAIREQAKKSIVQLKGKYFFESSSSALSAMADMESHLNGLKALVHEFASAYWSLKQEEQLVDFNDLEQLCIQALNHPEVAKTYQRQFRYVFVDEYQDTNRVQEEIVSLLRRSHNLFQVGDVKQSIYRFRMAEPELFLEKFYSYPLDAGAIRVDLNRNFRTHPHILEGVNQIFDQLLTEAFGDLSYKREGRLIPGREDFEGVATPRINLILQPKDEDQDVREGDSQPDREGDSQPDREGDSQPDADGNPEAQAIYQRLVELLKTEFYDTHAKVRRNYVLSDMVILMRSIKGRSQQLRDFLATKAIPVTIDEEDSYFDIVEVANVLNCLRILDNQYQDIPLLGVMRSAIGNFTDQELALLRTWHPKSFHEALKGILEAAESDLPEGQIPLRTKAKAFVDMLDQLRTKTHLPASEFLWHVLATTGYWYYVIGLEDGHYRRQHLEVLMEKARQFELEQQSGLHHFVEYLDQLQKSRVSYGGKANDKTDSPALRVMSIHKSKGLEFPVVFLAGAAKGFNLRDSKAHLVMHQKLGLGVRWMNPQTRQVKETLPLAFLKELIDEDSVKEEVRILYVALTRAVNHLEVFASVKDIEKSQKKWANTATPYQFSKLRSYVDWIMSAITFEPWDLPAEGPVHLKGWLVHQSSVQRADTPFVTSQGGQNSLRQLFGESPPKQWPDSKKIPDAMPAKLSVTELKQQGQTLVYMPRISALVKEFEPIQEGILRGNAYHAFAEHMPLDHTPAEQVLEKLLSDGRLTKEQGMLMDLRQLTALRESNWFQRVIHANRIWREHPFVWRKAVNDTEHTLIQGVVDLLFLEADGLVLLDYKSDRLFCAADFIQRYQRQLDLYKEAIELLLNIPVKETVIYSFALGEWIHLPTNSGE